MSSEESEHGTEAVEALRELQAVGVPTCLTTEQAMLTKPAISLQASRHSLAAGAACEEPRNEH
jgi:hypothetical protein